MINGNRVKQAREFCGFTQAYLAEQINVHQTTIAYIESGRTQPSDELVGKIALATKFPPAFFRQDDPPEFPEGSLLFRARKSLDADVRDRARRYGQLGFEIMEQLARRLRVVSPRIPQLTDEPTDVVTAARFTRNVFGVSPDTPIPHLIRAAEKCGVFVIAVPFSHPKVDAFSLWAGTDVRRPVLVAFGGTPGDRLRYSVAHELGHLAMHQALQGSWHAFDSEANEFASELLMPKAVMKEEIERPVTLTSLAALKPRWGVSMQALIRRARDIAYITERQYYYLNEQIRDNQWRMHEPIEVHREQPRAAMRMAELLYPAPKNGVDYQRLANDLNLTVSRVREYLDMQIGKQQLDTSGFEYSTGADKISKFRVLPRD